MAQNLTNAKSSLTPQVLTIDEKFKIVTIELLEAVSSMVSDANDAKLTEMVPNQVDMVINIIKKQYSGKDLIEKFLEKNELWPRLFSRDMKFLTEDVPKLFTVIKADVLIEPIRVYEGLKKTGYKGSKNEKKFPIGSEDIDGLWLFLDKLVKASCIYARDNKLKYNLTVYHSKVGL